MITWNIKNHIVEFIPETHQYLVDGVLIPSVTTIMKIKFGSKYNNVSKEVLERASIKGTEMHNAIEQYEKYGIETDLVELRNYKFLKKHYKWECIDNEIPVILFIDDIPVACGQIDEVAKIDGEYALIDFKRTSTLDKEYLTYQLNLYKIAFEQCYGKEIKFLRGIHLRNDVRKYIPLPINENMAISLLNEYLEKENV